MVKTLKKYRRKPLELKPTIFGFPVTSLVSNTLPLPPPATSLPVSVTLRSYHTSSDFIWPSAANQWPTSGWFPWQQAGPNILDLKRWVEVWEEMQWEMPRDWQLWWTEANGGLNSAVFCVRLCVCYFISPVCTAHPMDPVGKGGVWGCLFVGRKSAEL